MHLLRCLWFFAAHYDIYVTATHLQGITNITADHLSRGRVVEAFQSTPTLMQQSTNLPPSIFQLVCPQGLDWTSTQFLQLFQEAIKPQDQLTFSASLADDDFLSDNAKLL